MVAMFLGASIPMMEKRSLARRPQYQAVIDRVPMLDSPPTPKGRRYEPHMTRPRVVIAGFGDSGLLTAIKLGRHADIVGISAKPALLSGQELGLRLARPKDWARDNWVPFDKYRALDRVRTVQATLTGLDLENRTVLGTAPDGSPVTETYDVLVISTGVRNGFWRQPTLQTPEEIAADLTATHDRLGCGGLGDHRRRRCRGGQRRRQHCHRLAGQKGRPLLPG